MADSAPWLLVGLGNPGAKYANTRHNAGFMVVDEWREGFVPAPPFRDKHKGQVCSISSGVPGGGRCVILKPQTFMNLSGDSVGPAVRFHQVPVERVLVVHDELDFEPGRIAVKRGGGHGGHNGLRDIVRVLGSKDFLRIRVGIGRPQRGEVSSWVLTNFTGDDAIALPESIDLARRAIDRLMADGVSAAMNEFNIQAPKGDGGGKKKAASAPEKSS